MASDPLQHAAMTAELAGMRRRSRTELAAAEAALSDARARRDKARRLDSQIETRCADLVEAAGHGEPIQMGFDFERKEFDAAAAEAFRQSREIAELMAHGAGDADLAPLIGAKLLTLGDVAAWVDSGQQLSEVPGLSRAGLKRIANAIPAHRRAVFAELGG